VRYHREIHISRLRRRLLNRTNRSNHSAAIKEHDCHSRTTERNPYDAENSELRQIPVNSIIRNPENPPPLFVPEVEQGLTLAKYRT
jgi:hypothetical protein